MSWVSAVFEYLYHKTPHSGESGAVPLPSDFLIARRLSQVSEASDVDDEASYFDSHEIQRPRAHQFGLPNVFHDEDSASLPPQQQRRYRQRIAADNSFLPAQSAESPSPVLLPTSSTLTPPPTPDRDCRSFSPYLEPGFVVSAPRPNLIRPRKHQLSEPSYRSRSSTISTPPSSVASERHSIPVDFYCKLDSPEANGSAKQPEEGISPGHPPAPTTPRPSTLYRWTAGSMESLYSVWNGIRWFYNEVNPSTLTGAIDVMVVEQPDGSLLSTPFHVRFGKYGVLHSREKRVEIEINGEPVTLQMKLGETGEAYFVNENEDEFPEYLATSPLPNQAVDTDKLIEEGMRRLSQQLQATSATCIELQTQRSTDASQPQPGGLQSGQSMPRLPTLDSTEPYYTINPAESLPSPALFHIDDLDDDIESHYITDTKITLDRTPLAAPASDESLQQQHAKTCPQLSSAGSLGASTLPPTTRHSRKHSLGKLTLGGRKLTITSMSDTEISPNSSRSSSPGHLGPLSDSEECEVRKAEVAHETRRELGVDAATAVQQMDGMTDWKWGEMPDTLATPTQDKQEPSFPVNTADSTKQPDTVATSTEASKNQPQQQQQQQPGWGSLFYWSSASAAAAKPKDHSPPVEGVYLDQLSDAQMDPAELERYLNPRKKPTPSGTSSIHSPPQPLSPLPQPDVLPDDPTAAHSGSPQSDSTQASSLSERQSSGLVLLHDAAVSEDGGYNSQDSPARHLDGRGSPWSDHGEFVGDAALSLCGHSAHLTSDEFNQHLISYEQFQHDPMSFMNNDKMVLRMDGNFYSGRAAHAMLFSRAIFQRPLPETSLKPLSSVVGTPPNTPSAQHQQPVAGWFNWRRSASIESTPNKNDVEAAAAAIDQHQDSPQQPQPQPQQNLEAAAPPVPVLSSPSSDQTHQPPTSAPQLIQALVTVIFGTQTDSTQRVRYMRSLRLTSEQLKQLNLVPGQNEMRFSVTTKFQGTSWCGCHIYLFKYTDKIVVSDIDGTITKSDVLGHILPRVGAAWEHAGVAELFCRIQSNGYRIIYLSSRAIGMSGTTKSYLRSVEQDRLQLPDGPILLSPTSLLSALHKEVIEKRPEEFKMAALNDVQSLFPTERNPFYAGFGNRVTDVVSYKSVGIPLDRILTINPSGELSRADSHSYRSSYKGLATDVVDYIFPPLTNTGKTSASDMVERRTQFSDYTYWRSAPDVSTQEQALTEYLKRNQAAAAVAAADAKNKSTKKKK